PASLGPGGAGAGGAPHGGVEPMEGPPPTPRARELAREYRAVVETILEFRGARQIADVLAGVDDPSQLADTAAYSPDLTLEQRVELLESVDVPARLAMAVGSTRERLADRARKDQV